MQNLEKFVKNLSSLDKYTVLACSDGEVIIGTKFIFPQFYEIKHPTNFNIYRNITDREINVYFLVNFNSKDGKYANALFKQGVPILDFQPKNKKDLEKEKILSMLDEFTHNSFTLRPTEVQHKASNLCFMM